jgi:hypothetical protein
MCFDILIEPDCSQISRVYCWKTNNTEVSELRADV